MIVFNNVSKRYGKQTVLDNINLTIKGKEFVTIVGPSGAGKSTLINALIGAEPVQSGSITVDGYEITKMDDHVKQFYRRKIGVVFQDCKLLPKKTVYENTAFAMEVSEYPRTEIALKVPEILENVGLLHKKNRFPHELSGGEKQRAALARALVHDPKLLIADEPTGNLDPLSAAELTQLFMKINQQGVTIILATHDREMVDAVNKRVIAIDQGRIVADRTQSGYDITLIEDGIATTLHIE